SFVSGLTPAVAVLMVLIAWQIFNSEKNGYGLATMGIAGLSLVALLLKAPPPLVLLGAGLMGVIFFR
ncbi:MAG TPA: hypothetical protein VIS10_14900, partial [Anaerolineales bacterium]